MAIGGYASESLQIKSYLNGGFFPTHLEIRKLCARQISSFLHFFGVKNRRDVNFGILKSTIIFESTT